MGLDFSQKQLLGAALRSGTRGARVRRLQVYAVLTGMLSTLISLVMLVLTALKQ